MKLWKKIKSECNDIYEDYKFRKECRRVKKNINKIIGILLPILLLFIIAIGIIISFGLLMTVALPILLISIPIIIIIAGCIQS